MCASYDETRFRIVFTYRYETGPLTVIHEVDDLQDLQRLVDNGPDPRSIIKISVRPTSERLVTIRG